MVLVYRYTMSDNEEYSLTTIVHNDELDLDYIYFQICYNNMLID